MQELATEFICLITSEANGSTLSEGRRGSIKSMDLADACEELDLGECKDHSRLHRAELGPGPGSGSV